MLCAYARLSECETTCGEREEGDVWASMVLMGAGILNFAFLSEFSLQQVHRDQKSRFDSCV